MKKFEIELIEYLSRIVEVESNSSNEAINKVKKMWNQEEIVLDSGDFIEVTFNDINSGNDMDEKDSLINEIIEYLWKDEKRHFEELNRDSKNHIFLKLQKLKRLL